MKSYLLYMESCFSHNTQKAYMCKLFFLTPTVVLFPGATSETEWL